ncbi:MAG: type II toxin-antitoxin system HicB family antitoxin [Gemmatimonadota bacterium]|nr:type II toxin-antitoxin system HicB family antitoxin [Gemmatimonadota bacterium]
MLTRFTAVITKSEDLPLFIARCSQVGTVSQGKTEEEALKNLKEATELYLEEVTDSSHQTLHLA